MVSKGDAGYGRLDWGIGNSRRKLLHIEWINNNALLYSTGNYVHYPVINYNGKEYEKEYIYVCIYICVYIYLYTHTHITESLCCMIEINTTL